MPRRRVKGKKRIPKMDFKELKKLRRKLKNTDKRVNEQLYQALNFAEEVRKSCEEIDRLQRRVEYFLGKKKAMKCPVFESESQYDAKCRATGYCWGGWRGLFPSQCASCKLSPTQALKKATFRAVFKKPSNYI